MQIVKKFTFIKIELIVQKTWFYIKISYKYHHIVQFVDKIT